MSVTVKMISFTKRENSTKTPTSAQLNSGSTFNCTMIDDTSIMNPTFKISQSGSSMIGYNYCYVSTFNRYYFITNIRTFQNFWYVSCTCDVLATYKSPIGSQSHYVLRAASEYDENISDDIYPASTTMTANVNTADDGDPMSSSNGYCYILGIVSSVDEAVAQCGSLVYYMMNSFTLKNFVNYLSSNIDDWSYLHGEYSEGVQKALINPIQYIKTCMCFPIDFDSFVASSVAHVKFGYYSWAVPGGSTVKMIWSNKYVKTKETATITIPRHPQAATRGAFMNCQPFSSYTLHYGPWGDIDLDPLLLKNNTKIRVETLYDLVSGLGRLRVTGNVNTDSVMYTGTTQIAVEINLSQIYSDALGYQSALTNQVFTQMTDAFKGDIGGILGAGSAGVQNMTRLKYPTVAGSGSTGSFISMYDTNNLYLLGKFINIVDENITELGRPLCQVKQINTLSGYILCSGADCQISGTQEEAIKVNEYMNTGFFYE